VVTLVLPVEARITRPHPRIDALRGQVAIERGPVVLCLESADQPAGLSTESVAIDLAAGIVTSGDGADAVLARRADPTTPWPYHSTSTPEPDPHDPVPVHLIPYARWGNRGPSTMRVWIPEHDSTAPRMEER
jgi:uncharacterized protein